VQKIAVLTRNGIFLGRITQTEALRLLSEKKAKVLSYNKKRLIAITDLTDHFTGGLPQKALETTYIESLKEQRKTRTSKRVQPNYFGRAADLVKWDPGLTFEELRRGRFRHSAW
jgi:hypothetical protein